MRPLFPIALAIVTLTSTATADDEPAPPLPLRGCWSPLSEAGPSLDLRSDGTFAFQGTSGRFMTQDHEIWLLGDGEPRMGTKWRFTLDSDSLSLSKPEDFEYLGGSEYLYLKLTPTGTVWKLGPTRSEDLEACQRAAKVPPTP